MKIITMHILIDGPVNEFTDMMNHTLREWNRYTDAGDPPSGVIDWAYAAPVRICHNTGLVEGSFVNEIPGYKPLRSPMTKAFIIEPGGRAEVIYIAHQDDLADLLGGCFSLLKPSSHVHCWVLEANKGSPENSMASAALAYLLRRDGPRIPRLWGAVVFTGPADEFGEETNLDEETIAELEAFARAYRTLKQRHKEKK